MIVKSSSTLEPVSQELTFIPDNNHLGLNYSRALATRNANPDTTVVLLNWFRLSNVVLQVSVYCSTQLEDIVQQVLVWNNRPDLHLEHEEHFIHAGCPQDKLVIHNSPENVYFQARFLGCGLSSTPFCFLQDDDYLTRPEILRNIHHYFSNALDGTSSPVILQPPHDHLESDLLNIDILLNHGAVMSTSFACLGHGTFLLRSHAEEFMSLLKGLNMTSDELKIADNYFTILNGFLPEKWLTHTIELVYKDAVPFTSGSEGETRNWLHINRAMVYLDQLLKASNDHRPHFLPSTSRPWWTSTAPCIIDHCIIRTNIQTLPDYVISPYIWDQRQDGDDDDMRAIQSRRLGNLGQPGITWYTNNPVSHAVDGNSKTAFRSFGFAKKRDKIVFSIFGHSVGRGYLEMVFLVDASTASILYASDVEVSNSADEASWRPLPPSEKLECFPTFLPQPQNVVPPSVLDITAVKINDLYECRFLITAETGGIRITSGTDRDTGWTIYEVWIRQST